MLGVSGERIDIAPERWNDPVTGRRVTRLFPAGTEASHAYFTSTSFDGRGDLILSVRLGDRWQLCRVDASLEKAWRITDLPAMQPQRYCVSPAADCALVIDGNRLVKVDLSSGEAVPVFQVPSGWRCGIPTIDAAGSRAAFGLSESIPGFTRTQRLYSTMAENFFIRPRSLVCALELADGKVSVAWGETAWISHVLINPVDPNCIVFCHEGGHLNQHRLWAVDARDMRKKQARCLYEERFEDFLVHEYFVADGTLGVQRSWYDPGSPDALFPDGRYHHNSILFLHTNGEVVAEYVLPGKRSGHVQSNSDNSVIVADGCFTGDAEEDRDGRYWMALNHPDGERIRVERLCRHGSSMKTQLSHPHPVFSPDDRRVVFSSDDGGTNSVYVVEL